MSKLAVCIGQHLLIGMLVVSLGGHLALFQTIAWATMLKDFSRSTSIQEAARKTFSGEHPCSLCKAVEESKKEDNKKPELKMEAKMEITLPVAVRLKTPHGLAVKTAVPVYFGRHSDVSHGVLLQPPRCL